MRYALLLFSLFQLLGLARLQAQWEANVQLSLVQPTENKANVASGFRSRTGYSVGIDVMYGRRQLVPTAGLFYQQFCYFNQAGRLAPLKQQFTPTLGLLYRLRPAHTSFNLVGIAAAAPALVKEEILNGTDPGSPFTRLRWRARLGAALYFDYVTAHLDFWLPLGEDPVAAVPYPSGFLSYGLGIRF